ncbi:CBO0543 family protein [Desulfosporosinus sp. Sb-LF]|uniref:CBO0543 family protein n=1 Tax=Desulfosporosinus sp. Sb-LF TaxID=2560027 RepID=UPI00107F81CC|nr:CBO0543 family protein [Desulfosporosinus sp. Sb-LF]TGE34047.1 hypothetical protein E4K68_04445 [Desulfosporosinus sp. Sb-LF]
MSHLIIKVFTDYQIIVTIIIVAISLKWGDWRNWKRYYPTMLFYITGNFVYDLIAYNYPLWEYESPLLKTTFSDLLIALVFYPATIVLYLPHIPKGFLKQALWVTFWVCVYSIVEIVSYGFGFFSYHNGWSIGWSILFDCFMFPLLWLHYRKPVWGLLMAVAMAYTVIWYFQIPFSSMK